MNKDHRALRESTRHNYLPGTAPYLEPQRNNNSTKYDHEATKCHLRFGPGGLYPIANNKSQGLKSDYNISRGDNLIHQLEGLSIKEQCEELQRRRRANDIAERAKRKSQRPHPQDHLRFGPMGLGPATPKPPKQWCPEFTPKSTTQALLQNHPKVTLPASFKQSYSQKSNKSYSSEQVHQNSVGQQTRQQPPVVETQAIGVDDQNCDYYNFADENKIYQNQKENADQNGACKRLNRLENEQEDLVLNKQSMQYPISQDGWDRSTVPEENPTRPLSQTCSQVTQNQLPRYEFCNENTQDNSPQVQSQSYHLQQDQSNCQDQNVQQNISQQPYQQGQQEYIPNEVQKQMGNIDQNFHTTTQQSQPILSPGSRQYMGSGGYRSSLQNIIKDVRWESQCNRTYNQEYGIHSQDAMDQQAAGLPSNRIRRHRDIGRIPDRELLPYPNPNSGFEYLNDSIRQFRPRTAPPPSNVRVERSRASNSQLDRILGLAKTGLGHQSTRQLDQAYRNIRPSIQKNSRRDLKSHILF